MKLSFWCRHYGADGPVFVSSSCFCGSGLLLPLIVTAITPASMMLAGHLIRWIVLQQLVSATSSAAMDHLAVSPVAPGQAVVEQQVRKWFSPLGDLHPFDLGEVADADLSGLVGQREHHLGRQATECLPVLPAAAGFVSPASSPELAFAPAGIPARWWASGPDGAPRAATVTVPHLCQGLRPSPASWFGSFRLEAAAINLVGTGERKSRRRGSHLMAAAGSSFGHVQRNLLSGEGSRHGPVPCAWHRIQQTPSGAVNLIGATPQQDCRRTSGAFCCLGDRRLSPRLCQALPTCADALRASPRSEMLTARLSTMEQLLSPFS